MYKIAFKENAHIYLLSNISRGTRILKCGHPTLAQLVERLTVDVKSNQIVAGSIPASRSYLIRIYKYVLTVFLQ
jgi:hypothetical protein